MRELALIELMYMTRQELFALHAHISGRLPQLPEDSPERRTAHVNLSNIERALAHFELTPS